MRSIILLYFLIFIFTNIKGQEPEKCYNDFKDALKQLQDLNKTPKFDKMGEDMEFDRIRNIIEQLEITIQEFENIKKSLLPMLQDLSNILNDLARSEKDIKKLELIKELNKKIDEIIEVIKKIEDGKAAYQGYLKTCGEAKNKTLTLSNKLTELQEWDAKFADAKKYQKTYEKLGETVKNNRDEIDNILENTPIGLRYSCKILEVKFNDTITKIHENKNILEKLIKDFPNLLTINNIIQFENKNNPLLKEIQNILDKLTTTDNLDELENQLVSIYDELEKAWKNELEKVKQKNKDIQNWDNFLKQFYDKIPSIREKIEELKIKKQIEIQYREMLEQEKALQLNSASMSNAYCSIHSKPN